MRNFLVLILGVSFAMASTALAKDDGSDIEACKGVTDVCIKAAVTDAKTGKSGYQPGEWREKDGLWANCVEPLSKGKSVVGLSQPVSQVSAQACLVAYKAAHPKKK
jgi:hypothetical protein